jgi:hypothetical protein
LLLAQSQIPMPRVQWAMASSISSQLGLGFFPATMTLIRSRDRRQVSATASSVLVSGGSQTRMISAFLLTT